MKRDSLRSSSRLMRRRTWVIDAALVAQADGGLALDTQCLSGKIDVALVIAAPLPVSAGRLEACQSLAVMRGQVIMEPGRFLGVPFSGSPQMGQRSFDHDAPASCSSQSAAAGAARPRTRMRAGSVIPCRTSVTTMTRDIGGDQGNCENGEAD
jgi:hypothetical protein